MKALIIGAGVIGTIYGWAISEAGHDVTHVVRPGRAASLANGIAVDMFDKRRGHKKRNVCRYDLHVTESLDSSTRFDLIIVPTHHYELISVLSQYVPFINEDAGFVLLTQNWEGTSQIDQIIPQSRYLYGDAKAGGTFRDGKLVAAISRIDVGQVSGAHGDCLQKAVALFGSADLKPKVHENILHYLWVQYAISGGMWPVLVRAGSFDALLKDRNSGELAMKSVRECLNVVARRGVDLNKYPETEPYYRNSFLYKQIVMISMKYMFSHDEYTKRCSAHSLANSREVRTFFFDLLNTGRELGVTMPVMESFEQDIEKFSLKTA